MRRVCQCCGLVYGEKCGKCGSLNVERMETVFAWQCHDCGATWPPESQRDTHGICSDECKAKLRARAA